MEEGHGAYTYRFCYLSCEFSCDLCPGLCGYSIPEEHVPRYEDIQLYC